MLPNSVKKNVMRVPRDPQRKQVTESIVATYGRYPAGQNKPSQYISHFDIQKMGRVQGLIAGVNALFDLESGTRLKQPLDCCGCIEHDQRASLSARRTRTVSRLAVTGSR